MVRTFGSADTAALARGERVRRFESISAVARRKLRQLETAARLDDLRVPPWTAAGAEDVEIVDYH
jgi:proteic killer suppression protein